MEININNTENLWISLRDGNCDIMWLYGLSIKWGWVLGGIFMDECYEVLCKKGLRGVR